MIRLFNWFRRGSLERGLARELQYHFDRRVADLTTAGIPEAEARRRVAVELGLPAGLRPFPLGAQPASLLQAVKGGIERALVDLDDRARDLLQPLRDPVPVRGFER